MNGTRPDTRPILVLTAGSVEYLAVRDRLAAVRRGPSRSGTLFESGWLDGTPWRVVLAELGAVGNAETAALTTAAVQAFAPRALFFVGVAGSLKSKVDLGDVVAATKVYPYHGGKETGEGFGVRPVVWPATHELVQLARRVGRSDPWSRTPARLGGHGRSTVHIGPIAAGEVSLDAPGSALRHLLTRSYEDAVAIETEGAGVAAAAHYGGGLPALIVRGISNRADGSRESSAAAGWESVAARNAADFTFCVIRELDAVEEEEDVGAEGGADVPGAFDGYRAAAGLAPATLGLRAPALPAPAPALTAPARLAHRTESASPGGSALPAQPPPWQGGQVFSTPACRYLLHSEYLEERPSPDHSLVEYAAPARRLDPAEGAASPYVWLRQCGVLHPTPDALDALAALDREHVLLARLPARSRGLPGRGRYERIGNRRAVLALPWPVSRAGRLCGTLHSAWDTGRRHALSKGQLARLLAGLAGLCDTLALLHRAGATHRHLTSTGVIELDDGRLTLRDLGLAGREPRPGEGPAHHQAPEQGWGGHRPGLIGPPTDVYQLAALTYRLACGHPPDPAGPLPLRSHRGDVPDSLDRALRTALAQRPGERPGARALGSALRRARHDLLGDA
ncbi:phosphorylase family protein [Streptomyces sp. NPDC002306]